MSLPIQIPKPCHEDWQQMLPEEQGRHCLVCQKTVIDFTQVSDAEILSYFQQTPRGVCGRFRQEQLTPKPVTEVTQTSRWKMYLLALSATLALKTMLTETAKAQTPVEQREPQIPPLRVGTVADVHEDDRFTISGKVIDAESKEAIPGVSIVIKGITQGTTTNANGEFKFAQMKKGDILVVSSIGYVTQEIMATQSMSVNLIKLNMMAREDIIAGLAITNYIPQDVSQVHLDIMDTINVQLTSTKIPLHKRIFYRIKSWFH